MRKISRTIATAATAALFLGGAVIAATPASAATSECALGYACAWEHAQYSGRHVAFKLAINDLSSFGFNDAASSLYNHGRSMNTRWYEHAYFYGESLFLSRGSLADLTYGYAPWNDRISSAQFV